MLGGSGLDLRGARAPPSLPRVGSADGSSSGWLCTPASTGPDLAQPLPTLFTEVFLWARSPRPAPSQGCSEDPGSTLVMSGARR